MYRYKYDVIKLVHVASEYISPDKEVSNLRVNAEWLSSFVGDIAHDRWTRNDQQLVEIGSLRACSLNPIRIHPLYELLGVR
jgi:hypothetical protein